MVFSQPHPTLPYSTTPLFTSSDMPFNLPFKKSSSSSTSRRPSSPTPRPAISTNGSTCSSASETSSLEAAPMRPPAGSLTRAEAAGTNGVNGYGYPRPGFASRGSSGNGQRSPLQINTSPPTPIHGATSKQRQDSSTSTLLPPNRSSFHSPTNTTFSAPTSRESSVTRSPVTPRARQGAAYHSFAQPPAQLVVDPEARELFGGGLKGSSSGPDLASLRRRAAEERRLNGTPEQSSDPTITSSSIRGSSASPRLEGPAKTDGGVDGKDPEPLREGKMSVPGKGEPRRAVGLQDFVFGEVIGRGSYSTVCNSSYFR